MNTVSPLRESIFWSETRAEESTGANRGSRVLHGLLVIPAAVVLAIVLTAFLNPIQPVTAERSSGTTPVVLLKLGSAGFACLVGAWGLICSRRVRGLFLSLPGLALSSLALVFLITSMVAFGDSANISRACALILISYLAFAATSLTTVGIRHLVTACLVGQTLFLCAAWCAFLLFPSFGQFHEYTGAETTVARMGGLAHPNGIGREAAVLLLLALATFRSTAVSELSRWKGLGLTFVIGLSILTMAMTISRTSVLASAAGIAMLFFDRLYSRRGMVLALSGLVLLFGGLIGSAVVSRDSVTESMAQSLTKSGDVKELTSLTGRTRIWAEAIEWISQRPLTGYGLDSAASVMSKESVGTHNLFLHVTFSGGVFAGLLMLALFFVTFLLAIKSRDPLARGIATFVLVAGLVEDTLFPSFPGTLTLLWMTLLLAINMPQARPVLSSGEAGV
ncbi:MAG: O-antigen ligase family protein [Planctomycetota bacterium]